eukprot:353698-Chlamydomonas_euryale.AAC.13
MERPCVQHPHPSHQRQLCRRAPMPLAAQWKGYASSTPAPPSTGNNLNQPERHSKLCRYATDHHAACVDVVQHGACDRLGCLQGHGGGTLRKGWGFTGWANPGGAENSGIGHTHEGVEDSWVGHTQKGRGFRGWRHRGG